MIRTVIFDMDNTIVECAHLHVISLNKALHSIDSRFVISEEENKLEFEALPTKMKLEILTKKRGLPVEYHKRIHDLKQQYTLEFIEMEIIPNEDIIAVFMKLKMDGFKIYVASNSIRITIAKMLEKLRVSQYVDYFISNEEVQNPKPHPEMFLKCMIHGGFRPYECLVVEDSFYGQKAAIDSGANLMPVKSPKDVNLTNVYHFIRLYSPFELKTGRLKNPPEINKIPGLIL